MFVSLDEVTQRTPKLQDYSEGPFNVTVGQQRLMLGAVLNAALFALLMGQETPEVTIEYSKVTDTPPRIGGTDYRATPGMMRQGHAGRIIKLARNRNGDPYVVILDRNRAKPGKAGYTAFRLEGIKSFGFASPEAQDRALGLARALRGGR